MLLQAVTVLFDPHDPADAQYIAELRGDRPIEFYGTPMEATSVRVRRDAQVQVTLRPVTR